MGLTLTQKLRGIKYDCLTNFQICVRISPTCFAEHPLASCSLQMTSLTTSESMQLRVHHLTSNNRSNQQQHSLRKPLDLASTSPPRPTKKISSPTFKTSRGSLFLLFLLLLSLLTLASPFRNSSPIKFTQRSTNLNNKIDPNFNPSPNSNPDNLNDSLSPEQLSEIEKNAPSELTVMKQLLGINVFTLFLSVAIVIFISLNSFLGPGWLAGNNDLQSFGEGVPGKILDLGQEKFTIF